MTWVKFHEALRHGDKRGLPRATRFIFLELALLARPKNGIVRFPRGMGDAESLCDILGGNRKEICAAIQDLTDGADPMVVLDADDIGRYLEIPSWNRWNKASESPGASTPRVGKFRAKQRDETIVTPTVSDACNGEVTLVKQKPEERRSDQIPLTPTFVGGSDSVIPEPDPSKRRGLRSNNSSPRQLAQATEDLPRLRPDVPAPPSRWSSMPPATGTGGDE